MAGNNRSGYTHNQSRLQRLVADNLIVPDMLGRQPSEPSAARPGSAEKIAILAARSANAEPLFGDLDEHLILSATECTARNTEHLASRFGSRGVGRPPK